MENNEYIRIGGWHFVTPNEVIMLQADINYTTLHFANGKKMMVATTLKHLESRLKPFNFFRTHRSFMVNMDCIKHFSECESSIEMTDNQIVDISRRKLGEFKRKYVFS